MRNAAEMPQSAVAPFRLRVSHMAAEPHWGLGFVGLFFFIFVQYTSLSLMYPVLAPLHLAKIAVGLALLGYLIAPRVQAQVSKDARIVDAAMVLLLFSVFISVVLNSGRTGIWGGFADVLRWVVIYFLLSRLLTSRWRLSWIIFLLLLLNLKMSQFSIRTYMAGLRAGYSGMEIVKLGGASGARTTAFFGNADDFGMAMSIIWALTLPLLLRKNQKLPTKLFLAICFTGFLLSVLLCGSRGAVVGAAAVVLVVVMRARKKAGAILVLLLFAVALLFVMPGAGWTRFHNAVNWKHDKDVYSRLMLWKAGLYMWANHPMFGVGPSEFHEAFVSNPEYVSWSPFGTGARAAHSIYIETVAELGTSGLLLLALAVLGFFYMNSRTRKWVLAHDPEGRQSLDYCLSAGLDLAMVAYLTCGAFLAQLYYPHLWILLGLGVATNRVCTATPLEKPGFNWRGVRPKRSVSAVS